MNITFTGRQTEFSAELKGLVQERVRKLERLFGEIVEAHVILTAVRHRFQSEIVLHARSHTLSGDAETTAARASLQAALEKIEKQARRVKEKWTGRRKRIGKSLLEQRRRSEPAAPESEDRPRVIASDGFSKKPITVDEAAMKVQESERGFLVFRNADTLQISVIYRRKDGNFGLIQPDS